MGIKKVLKKAGKLSPAYQLLKGVGKSHPLYKLLKGKKKKKKGALEDELLSSKAPKIPGMKHGGKVTCRGMGAAKRGGRYRKDG